jgi:HlyD family secretion protein
MANDSDVKAVLEDDVRGRRRKRWLVAGAGLVVLVGVAVTIYLARQRTPDPSSLYQTAEVRQGDLKVVVTATGTVDARNRVEVGAEVSGRLIEVLVDFNDRVEPGQVLARIDPTPFELEVVQSQARLQSARASLLTARATEAEARQNLRRFEALAAEGLVSRQDLDAARATAERAKASIASAQAQVAEAEAAQQASTTRLEKTTIRSPIAGIVLDRKVEAGQTVTAGFQTPELFSLATDLTEMELNAAIDEADVGRIRDGQDATFTVDAYPDRVFQSHVVSVRNVSVLTQNVVTYEAVLSVDNDDRALRPGMTATATIVTSRVQDAVLVPNAALRFKPPKPEAAEERSAGGNPFMMGGPPRGMRRSGQGGSGDKAARAGSPGEVYVLEGGRPVARPIVRGETDGDHTVMLEGELAPGTRVITDLALQKGSK